MPHVAKNFNFVKPSRLKLLFFGSDKFSLSTLKCLYNLGSWLQVDVVTKSQTIVEKWGQDNSLKVQYWPPQHLCVKSNTHFTDENSTQNQNVDIKNGNYDVGMVVSFGHLIDELSINSFRQGIYNIHPSLLPRWRGSSPIQKAILAGDTHTGVSLMRVMPHKFDIGDIILQEKVEIKPRETAIQLHDRLAKIGAEVSAKFINNIEGHLKNSWTQNLSGLKKTYATKLKPEDGFLDLNNNDAFSIDRRYRAYYGFLDIYVPWTNGTKLRLHDMQDPYETQKLVHNLDYLSSSIMKIVVVQGQRVFYHKRRKLLCFGCTESSWVAFGSVSLLGRRRMSALEFYNGYLSKFS